MYFMAGPAGSQSLRPLSLHSTPHALFMVLLMVLVTVDSVSGKFLENRAPSHPLEFPKYLRCYQCLFETKELGCLLGSDICLVPRGSSCITLHIRNNPNSIPSNCDCIVSGSFSPIFYGKPAEFHGWRITEYYPPLSSCSGTDIMVSGCRHKEQMQDCTYTHTSPVFGFWISSQCCFVDFCNDPQSRAIYNS